MNFSNGFMMIVDVLFGMYISILLIRFLSQNSVNPNNPLMHTFMYVTETIVKPIRSVFPRLMGLDFSAFIVAWIIVIVKTVLLFSLGGIVYNMAGLMPYTFFEALSTLLTLVYWLIIARVVISWVAPTNNHPAISALVQITNPFMLWIQRIIPSFGGLDFSPIVLILGISFFQMTVLKTGVEWSITLLSS